MGNYNRVPKTPVPENIEPSVRMHHVLGEELDASINNEERVEIQREILAYEEGLLTAVETNPSLTLKGKRIVTNNQKRIIQEAKTALEEALNQKTA